MNIDLCRDHGGTGWQGHCQKCMSGKAGSTVNYVLAAALIASTVVGFAIAVLG